MPQDFLIGLLVGLMIAFIAAVLTRKKYEALLKPKTQDIILDPNDFPVPDALPLFKGHRIQRSTEFQGNTIVCRWMRKGVSSTRSITINNMATAQIDFRKFWEQEEVGFYLRNKELFPARTKPRKKKK